MKCKFFKYKNENGGITTVAVSRYAGRKVKAYAKCSPADEYDEAKGQDVAKRKMLYHYNTDKVRAINAALADLEVIEERLKRQRKIATERMKRDKKFLRRNCR